jgi:RNA-directed DNA polymerase
LRVKARTKRQQGSELENSTGMEPQTTSGRPEQLHFEWRAKASVGPGKSSEAAGGATVREVQQMSAAQERTRALEQDLMAGVADEANLVEALRRVCANKGSAGIDQMSVAELKAWFSERANREKLKEQLRSGTYPPAPVRGVQIPKPGGKGMRQLGIPTVVDRLVQQAVLQRLEPIFDPNFSESSYGFRPGRGAHDALRQASKYVGEDGRVFVVDLDLEKFFDRVQHDVLMARVGRKVRDKRLLALIGRFLRAGLMQNGVCVRREEGTPQGGPLSPLLANILLDDLDKELEARGHKFCRYADDCNIYMKSEAAGQRVLESVTEFLEKRLKLKVNREKSAVGKVSERKFLGHRLLENGTLGVAPQSQERLKDNLKELTCRNAGRSFQSVLQSVNQKLAGWIQYFRMARMKSILEEIAKWLRRRLRCLKLKQCKRAQAIARFLMGLGVREDSAWMLALSGKGWWRLADTPQAHRGMSLSWFKQIGLIELEAFYLTLQRAC